MFSTFGLRLSCDTRCSLLAVSLIEDFLDEYDIVDIPGVSSFLSLGKAKPLDSKIVFEYYGGKLNTR